MGRATLLLLSVAVAGSVRLQPIDGARAAVDPLTAPPGAKAIVYLFTSTDCPISNRYAPEVRRLAQQYGPRGIVFRLVYPGRADSDAAIRTHLAEYLYRGVAEPFRDASLAFANLAGARITPEAVVIAQGRVVYRGRIDDRYADVGVDRTAATTHDLADALDAVVAGRAVPHPVTHAVGCYIADLAR